MITKFTKQKGFTVIEMIVSLAITGIIGLGITTFAIQTMTESNRSNNRTQAIMQVENAGFWLSRDVQMSQNITLGSEAGFPLQLAWKDIEENKYEVTFSINEGQIKRSKVKNDGQPSQIVIAESINSAPALTSCNYTDGLLTFNVTATVGSVNTSRTFEIKKRTDAGLCVY